MISSCWYFYEQTWRNDLVECATNAISRAGECTFGQRIKLPKTLIIIQTIRYYLIKFNRKGSRYYFIAKDDNMNSPLQLQSPGSKGGEAQAAHLGMTR
jgi:hypothetical protein